MPTTQEIINIAKVSQYLCENDIAKKGLSGGGIDLQLPNKIYNIRKNVEWLNGLDSNDDSLIKTGNYLYALCAPYNQQAAFIIGGGNSGNISPIGSSNYSYVKRQYTITSDSVSFFHSDLVDARDLSIFLDNQPLLVEGTDYTFYSATGVITGVTFQFFTGSILTATFNKKFNA